MKIDLLAFVMRKLARRGASIGRVRSPSFGGAERQYRNEGRTRDRAPGYRHWRDE